MEAVIRVFLQALCLKVMLLLLLAALAPVLVIPLRAAEAAVLLGHL